MQVAEVRDQGSGTREQLRGSRGLRLFCECDAQAKGVSHEQKRCGSSDSSGNSLALLCSGWRYSGATLALLCSCWRHYRSAARRAKGLVEGAGRRAKGA
eukprot:1887579-Prymnesium_polylepis.2